MKVKFAMQRDSLTKPVERIRLSRDTKLQSKILIGKHLRVPNDVIIRIISYYIGMTPSSPLIVYALQHAA